MGTAIKYSFYHWRGRRRPAAHAVEQTVLDHLRHEPVDHFYGRLAGVFSRFPKFVLGTLLMWVCTGNYETATTYKKYRNCWISCL